MPFAPEMLNKITLCLLLALAGCQATKEPATYRNYIGSWSPDGKQILFYSDRNGNWDVFLVNADGTGLSQVTSSESNETEPSWHPTRNEFVFAADTAGERKISVYDRERNQSRAISDAPGKHSSPMWSPDGSSLAYLVNEGENWKVVVQKHDTNPVVLYDGSTYPGRPTWSPRGDAVLYSVAVNGTETLHLVNLDGKVIETIVTGYNSTGNAVISPDGMKIAFDAHSNDVLDSGDGKWEIFVMTVAVKSVARLTTNDKDDWGARWSPDGSKICFLGGGFRNAGYELYVMHKDGSGIVQLTDKTTRTR